MSSSDSKIHRGKFYVSNRRGYWLCNHFKKKQEDAGKKFRESLFKFDEKGRSCIAEYEGHDEEEYETSESDSKSHRDNDVRNYHITREQEQENDHATNFYTDDILGKLGHENDIDDNFEEIVPAEEFFLVDMDQHSPWR